MASYLVQSGTSLYLVSHAGVATEIEFPTDIELLGEDSPLRVALFSAPNGFDPYVVGVNGASRDFFIRSDGTVYPLAIAPPTAGPVVSSGSSTGLTGVYQVAITYKVKDANGYTIYETSLSPASNSTVSLTDDSILIEEISISSDPAVTSRGVYRTTAGGNTFYPWFDIDDNLTLTLDRGTAADADLSILSTDADLYGTPPYLKLIVSWGGRLWGISKDEPDRLRWAEENIIYGWSASNEIIIPPAHVDITGVTAFIPRRDQLGVAKKDRLYQIVGYDNDTFQRLQVSESIGCLSQESVVVIRDTAYWLGERGVVEWSADSIGYVSEAQVDSWFNTDTYFNRAMFSSAQGRYNPDTDSYELLLAAAGSEDLDRWVSFDLKGRRWFGPHLTTAFTPTCTGNDSDAHGTLQDEDDLPITVFGSEDGYLYKRDSSVEDDHNDAVEFDVDLPYIHMGEPDYEKYFGELSVNAREESDGDLTITVKVGDLDATAQPEAITHDLTVGRRRHRRLGVGKYMQLNFNHSTEGEGFRLFGIEFPWHLVGRR